MPTDPTPQAEQRVCVHCEKNAAEHTDNPADYSNCGDFEPSPAPQAPETAPQGEKPTAEDAYEKLIEGWKGVYQDTVLQLRASEAALTAAREERDYWKQNAEYSARSGPHAETVVQLRGERDRLEKLVQLHNDSAVEANQRSQEYMAKYDKLVADGWDVLKKVAEERDRAQEALRKADSTLSLIRHRGQSEPWTALMTISSLDQVIGMVRTVLNPASDRQPEGEKP